MNKKDKIIIKGARLNNLKNISVSIPKNKLIVVTGLSGSGKSSFAYDTIYAEAQRRYIESLSSYARQFLNNHQKPEFDTIKGLSPAIALEHKTSTNNPRSTVGTSTEIYHYLTLLFERLGRVISPASKQEVKPIQFEDFKQFIFKQKRLYLKYDEINIGRFITAEVYKNFNTYLINITYYIKANIFNTGGFQKFIKNIK